MLYQDPYVRFEIYQKRNEARSEVGEIFPQSETSSISYKISVACSQALLWLNFVTLWLIQLGFFPSKQHLNINCWQQAFTANLKHIKIFKHITHGDIWESVETYSEQQRKQFKK